MGQRYGRSFYIRYEGTPMTPFIRGEMIPRDPPPDFEKEAAALGVPTEDYRHAYEETMLEEVWINDVYQVNVRRHEGGVNAEGDEFPPIIHLSIKRRDKAPVIDWRDKQQIKNELTSPEFEAIELFPAESRLVDTANQYHLWVFADASLRIPVGFPGRLVNYEDTGSGAVQRPK